MALRRFTKSVDGTIPVPALLYADEELLSSQDGVGIYDGHSFALDLSHISQTDHYSGLFTSSSKVTLHLELMANKNLSQEPVDVFESWVCEVCGNRNPSGFSPAAARICVLCGVPRASVPPPLKIKTASSIASLPASSSGFPSPSTTPTSPHLARQPSTIACPACTFLNHPSLRECEICGTPLPHLTTAAKSAPVSRPSSPPLDGDTVSSNIIKLSFRRGGDRPFYSVLKRSLQSKRWEGKGIGNKSAANMGPFEEAVGQQASRSGITGVLQTVENTAQSTTGDMRDALQDLEALRIKARDMVRLAAELNERLTATSSTTVTQTSLPFPSSSTSGLTPTLIPSTEPEEATFIRSSLSQLGLQMENAPVTLDMIRDERKWNEELARELAGVLQGIPDVRPSNRPANVGIMRQRGILALDEVWGGWNRARGVALIPPSTFLSVLSLLPTYTTPAISLRKFPSGLMVLHTPPFAHAAFSSRVTSHLAISGPCTTMDVAQQEGIALALASEMISVVEADGDICRDDATSAVKGGGGIGGVEIRWWKNIFKEYEWDGEDG